MLWVARVGGKPWQERRERIVPKEKPVPRLQPCWENTGDDGVWLVEDRIGWPARDLCRARLPY